MPIFLVTPFVDPQKLADTVEKNIVDHDRYLLKNGSWLIRFDGTSKEVSDKIGITNPDPDVPPTVGSCLIVSISGYYGRGPTDMWEWIKTRLEK